MNPQIAKGKNRLKSKVSLETVERGQNRAEKIEASLIKENDILMREKYMFPATIEKALYHKRAVKFGYQPSERGLKRTICACCGISINKEEIQLCHETSEIDQEGEFKLNSGVVMFFSFIKMLITFLVMRVLIFDGFNVITSVSSGQYCEYLRTKYGDQQCQVSLYTTTSSINKVNRKDMIYDLDLLNFILTACSITFFLVYRRIQYKIYDEIDEYEETQDDYSILIQNIPLIDVQDRSEQITVDYRNKLKEIMEDKIKDWLEDFDSWDQNSGVIQYEFKKLMEQSDKQPEPQIVTSICLCYDLESIEKLPQLREEIMKEHQKRMENLSRQIDIWNCDQAIRKLEILNQTELGLCSRFAKDSSLAFNITHFIQCAFVSFQYQHYRQYILRELRKDKNFLMYNLTPLEAQQSAHPRDIIWQNLKVKKSDRKMKILRSYIILFTVLAVAFIILFQNNIIKVKIYQAGLEKDRFGLILNFIASAITYIINQGLRLLIVNLAVSEKHKSKEHENFSIVMKLLITQFINTALIYFIVACVIPIPLLGKTGIVVQITTLFVTTNLIEIFMNALDSGSLIKKAHLWWKYSRVGEKESVPMFQVELNKQFEYPEFKIAERYAYYLLQMYTISFYSELAPFGVIAMIGIFACQYWVDKYNLFTRSSFLVRFNYSLSRNVLKLFQCSILVSAIGNFFFGLLLHRLYDGQEYFPTSQFIILGIAFIYVLFTVCVPHHIEQKIYNNYETLQKQTYESCIKHGKFNSTYWYLNPTVKFIKEENAALGKAYPNPALKFDIAGVQEKI